MRRCFALLLAVLACCLPIPAFAQQQSPAEAGESIRATLVQLQLKLNDAAAPQLEAARQTYTSALAPTLARSAAANDNTVREGFAAAAQALRAGDGAAFADARAQIWTGVLGGSYHVVEAATAAGDVETAQAWLPLREFRTATRFSRPNADATLALRNLKQGQLAPEAAMQLVQADLLDTYQARLLVALNDLANPTIQGFPTRRAELAATAVGYFAILAPTYGQQRGDPALNQAQAAFAALRAAALQGENLTEPLAAVETHLTGFRAAPLSQAEQERRAGQLLRFLSLVPVEYERGVRDGRVTLDLEIREATTFRDGAAAAFNDLRDLLHERDAARTTEAAQLFAELEGQLRAATPQSAPDPALVEATTDQLTAALQATMPAEWQKPDSSADFDVIQTALDQMEAAVAAGQYELAESSRLEAYAILESGPEAKLIVFAPQFKPILEDLFWYGQGEQKGLAHLIAQQAPAATIKQTRVTLNTQLAAAQQALTGNNAPLAVATNAAVIVFREGLEAVLILASLMGSLKLGEQRKFRTPLWWGTGLAFLATILTWVVAREALLAMARYGERLEAIVSIIAIAVLLLITNWFFHDVYWKGWIASFHSQKKRLVGGTAGQWVGLVVLGFTSVYREGFETVLFLQALVLEAGPATVLAGIGVGLLGTLLIGLVVFAMQAKLPYKKMLIVTGILIGAVLLQMVGNTVHVMQVVGWMPLHPIRWLELPYWSGFWFGLYATWEGIAFQASAATFVIGSYYLAEHMHKREQRVQSQAAASVG
ncbi:MAG: FTR1 family protein [Chloroflexaceae bacterium]|jgi:high-affinity iron transporter|nr:FTR1 family protein [Chloroflexaceae bacterium]